MKTYFDEETDKKLLEASTEEEVRAIIAETPEAEKLADKIDLVMKEISRVKGSLDEEVDLDELDNAAGGAKRKDVYLSETQGCVATFWLDDQLGGNVCWSNDQCRVCNEYKYHNTRYANCRAGGKHEWASETGEKFVPVAFDTIKFKQYVCQKCYLEISCSQESEERFNS